VVYPSEISDDPSFFVTDIMVTFRIEVNQCHARTIEERNDYSFSHSRWPATCVWRWIVRRQNTGLSFSPCFLSVYLFSPILTSCKHTAEERIREQSRFRRRDRTPGGRGRGREEAGDADGPRGALGFHYAKPQMESCDRVSLRGRPPKAHTMAPVARLLRCNVT